MVRIGLVGIGFMGMIHYLAYQQIRGGRVAAICSRDARKRGGDWRSIRGNFGPPGARMNLSGVKRYRRLEELLADHEVDVVDVCLPTNLHADAAVAVLGAGKHVLVEKPIALGLRDADAMLRAAKRAGKLLLVAHVVPFFAEFAYALKAIQSGQYGRLLAAHFKRITAIPDWSAEAVDAANTGGPAVDLHVHDAHFIALACGVPRAVMATGCERDGFVRHLESLYIYGGDGPPVSCSAGSLGQPGRPFSHGFDLHFEQAALSFELGARPLTLLTADGKIRQPRLRGSDPVQVFEAELQAAIDGLAAGQEPAALSGRLARDALSMCRRECQSARIGRPVRVL